MTSRYDLVPRHPGAPSLVVTVERPPYHAPERPVPPVYRPFALGAGGGGVATAADAYSTATAPAPAPEPAAAPVASCGCRS